MTILVDFGDIFYLPEMEWSKKTQFRCAGMPSRWVERLQTLGNAKASPVEYFLTTEARLNELDCGDDVRERIWADVDNFLSELITYYTPFAQRWLKFPRILFGLGCADDRDRKLIATHIVLSREQKQQPAHTGVVAGIHNLHLEHHKVFEQRIFTAIKASRSRPLTASVCAPLLQWLRASVLCVSHQNLTVEGSFNHMSNIISKGGGSRSLYTQVGVQAHLQNECLPSRTHTGKKFRYTRENLHAVVESVKAYAKKLQNTTPVLPEVDPVDYLTAFAKSKRRAQPNRRKQYDTATEAQHLSLRCPYDPEDKEDSDNKNSEDSEGGEDSEDSEISYIGQ